MAAGAANQAATDQPATQHAMGCTAAHSHGTFPGLVELEMYDDGLVSKHHHIQSVHAAERKEHED